MPASSVEPLHGQVLAYIGFSNDEIVDVEAVIVFRVGHGRHHAFAHVVRDPLTREFEIGQHLVDFLSPNETSDKIKLLR